MAEFHAEKKIKPYEITVDVLGKIEEYILDELPSKMELDPERVNEDYTFRLYYGRSESINLNSVEEFRGEVFEDDLERISLSISSYTFSLTFATENLLAEDRLSYMPEGGVNQRLKNEVILL